jgi:hypothetical protein
MLTVTAPLSCDRLPDRREGRRRISKKGSEWDGPALGPSFSEVCDPESEGDLWDVYETSAHSVNILILQTYIKSTNISLAPWALPFSLEKSALNKQSEHTS